MADPRSEDSGVNDIYDNHIKKMLVSAKTSDRELGLAILKATKGEWMCGLIRIASDEGDWHLEGADLVEIWDKAMESFEKKVMSGKFKMEGNLHSLICTITTRKTCDFLERRKKSGFWIDHDIDVETVVATRYDDPHTTTGSDYVRVIRFFRAIWPRYKRLSKRERLIMKHDVRLFYAGKTAKWPSPNELTVSANRDRGGSFTVAGVRSIRARARRKLRR